MEYKEYIGKELFIKYQGKERLVVPLVHGVLKNGKEAVLCYRIVIMRDSVDFVIRLYHTSKMTDAVPTGCEFNITGSVDYKMKKHFKIIYAE